MALPGGYGYGGGQGGGGGQQAPQAGGFDLSKPPSGLLQQPKGRGDGFTYNGDKQAGDYIVDQNGNTVYANPNAQRAGNYPTNQQGNSPYTYGTLTTGTPYVPPSTNPDGDYGPSTGGAVYAGGSYPGGSGINVPSYSYP